MDFVSSKFPKQWTGILSSDLAPLHFFPSHVHQRCCVGATLPEHAERIRAAVATVIVILNSHDKYGLKMNTHTSGRPLTMPS